MADPAVLVTAIGTATTGGILAIAKLIEAISNFIEARRAGGGDSSRRRDMRKARQYEKKAQDLRDHYRRDDDDDGGGSLVPFEQAWMMA